MLLMYSQGCCEPSSKTCFTIKTLMWDTKGRNLKKVHDRCPAEGVECSFDRMFPNTRYGLNGRNLTVGVVEVIWLYNTCLYVYHYRIRIWIKFESWSSCTAFVINFTKKYIYSMECILFPGHVKDSSIHAGGH